LTRKPLRVQVLASPPDPDVSTLPTVSGVLLAPRRFLPTTQEELQFNDCETLIASCFGACTLNFLVRLWITKKRGECLNTHLKPEGASAGDNADQLIIGQQSELSIENKMRTLT
jgi:hypothetical protein